jgi:hypothetical protein
MQTDTNSRRTRVEPVFRWLTRNGGPDWPRRLLHLADGLIGVTPPGSPLPGNYTKEARVAPSPTRLAWMLRHAERLAPRDGRRHQEFTRRVLNSPRRPEVLRAIEEGRVPTRSTLILEGKTSADWLIECERALIWIEGKRYDWLDTAIKWDTSRDQVARNVEAAWLLAQELGKDYWVLICHEYPLKHHEAQLIAGYRAGTWNGGWPHLPEAQRREFGQKIGTLRWAQIAEVWPQLREEPTLRDLSAVRREASST